MLALKKKSVTTNAYAVHHGDVAIVLALKKKSVTTYSSEDIANYANRVGSEEKRA